MNQPLKILVTGATGMVGGHLLWHLLQQNKTVRAIRRTSSSLSPLRTIFCFYTSEPDTVLSRIEWVEADVLNRESLQMALSGVDIVYHCAAVVSLGNHAQTLIETNVTGTRNIVDLALEACVSRFCFVSSIAACGRSSNELPITENAEWNDHPHKSDYSRSKFYSEQEVWRAIEKGLSAVIVNPGVILGVSGTPRGSSQLFEQVRKGLIFYTNGGSGYVDVQDVVRAMMELVESGISSERFILTSGNYSNKEILSWMADGFGKKRPFIGVGKPILLIAGWVSQFFSKCFGLKLFLDPGLARTAANREYYSSEKILRKLDFTFTPIEKTISTICRFMMR